MIYVADSDSSPESPEGQPFTAYDYFVLRAAQLQYWLWLALSRPEYWEEDPRHYVLARVRVAYGLDAG